MWCAWSHRWRDAIREAAAKRAENAAGEPVGDAATWPPLENLAIVLTGRRVVLYDGGKGLRKLRGPVSEYSLERIASIAFDKGKMWNVVRIAFANGSVRELDSSKGSSSRRSSRRSGARRRGSPRRSLLLGPQQAAEVLHQQEEMEGIGRRRLEVEPLVEGCGLLVLCVDQYGTNTDLLARSGCSPECIL